MVLCVQVVQDVMGLALVHVVRLAVGHVMDVQGVRVVLARVGVHVVQLVKVDVHRVLVAVQGVLAVLLAIVAVAMGVKVALVDVLVHVQVALEDVLDVIVAVVVAVVQHVLRHVQETVQDNYSAQLKVKN